MSHSSTVRSYVLGIFWPYSLEDEPCMMVWYMGMTYQGILEAQKKSWKLIMQRLERHSDSINFG